jgi:hypothetical protein
MPMRWPSSTSSRQRAVTLGLLGGCVVIAACGWNPDRPFEREAPQVNSALGALDGGDAHAAATTLEDYLSTGACSEGSIGAPELVRKRPNGTFDLGLSLFKIGESYGKRFGDEEVNGSASGQGPQKGPDDEKLKAERGSQIACALRVVGAVAADDSVPLELRTRARYLEGNLNFLDGHYEEAVSAYDKALTLAPGEPDGGDPTGRDAAFNRAIALKRIEDKKDSGQDGAQPDSGGEGGGSDGGDSGHDSGSEAGGDSGGGGQPDSAGQDSGSQDSGASSPDSSQPPPHPPDAGSPPPPTASQDERILDQLENAPTVQQEAAKKAATRHQRRGMADK